MTSNYKYKIRIILDSPCAGMTKGEGGDYCKKCGQDNS
jgi:hypothetical protein